MDPLSRIEQEASPTVVHADVCADGRLLAEYRDVLASYQQYGSPDMLAPPKDAEQLADRVRDLHEQVQARTHRYTFACIDRADREALADKHPPTKKQKEQDAYADPAGFEPALAAASLVEVDGEPVGRDLDDVEDHFVRLRREMPPGEHGWGVIWQAVLSANGEGTQVPKSVSGIVDRLVSELNSTTPPRTASRSNSSGAPRESGDNR